MKVKLKDELKDEKQQLRTDHSSVSHYFPKFNQWLKQLTDIRNQDLIIYQRQTIIWVAWTALLTKRQSRMGIRWNI
jgi:hypothetical protein